MVSKATEKKWRLARARHAKAYRLRESGKAWREVADALGGVSITTAFYMYLKHKRRREKAERER